MAQNTHSTLGYMSHRLASCADSLMEWLNYLFCWWKAHWTQCTSSKLAPMQDFDLLSCCPVCDLVTCCKSSSIMLLQVNHLTLKIGLVLFLGMPIRSKQKRGTSYERKTTIMRLALHAAVVACMKCLLLFHKSWLGRTTCKSQAQHPNSKVISGQNRGH